MASQKTQPELRPESEPRNDHPDVSARPDTAIDGPTHKSALAADRMRQSLTDSPAPFAAAVYRPKAGDRKAVARFVDSLKRSNFRVGGILQEKVYLGDSGMRRVDAINIATGQRISINKPTSENWRNRVCSLDVSALAATAAILRGAIEDQVDLIIVEKFGDEEREGKGLIDEILQGIASGIPLLIAVPETNLDAWTKRSGGMGDVLPFDEEAFDDWWALLKGKG